MNQSWRSYKGLIALSLPSILATMLEPISSVVDTSIVGRYDTNLLAALAVGATLISSLTWMFNFLVHAPIRSISDKIGKAQYSQVASLCKVALLAALVLGLGLIVLIYPIRFWIYEFMSVDKSILGECDDYFSVRLFGQSFILLFTVSLSLVRGFAKVNQALIFIAISTVSNVVLSYLSIHYFGWGLLGVAWATVFGNALGFVFSFFYLLRQREISSIFWKTKILKQDAFEFGSDSLNIFGRSSFLTLSFFLSTKVASYCGVKSLAAHQIILQIWLFASFFTDGVATTGNIIGARLFKASGHEDLKEIFKRLLILGLGIGVAFCGVFLLFKNIILEAFTSDTEVIKVISTIWPLLALSQVPLSLAYVYDGLIFGIGRFSFLRKHMMIAFFLCFIPFAAHSYYQESLLGVWVGLTAIGLYRLVSNYFCVRYELG